MAKQEPKRPVVLIVEDEPLTLLDTAELIAELGFEPLSARNADEAIIILESRDDIRVVFTDINMPGSMDGLKLAHAVRGSWPPIEIVVTSALGISPKARMPERGVFLAKPYTSKQIADVLYRFAA